MATRGTAKILVPAALAAVLAAPALAASPTGVWLTEGGEARIRTEMCGPEEALLCGYVVWTDKALDARGQPFVDKNNPEPRKRTRLLLGHQLMLGLKPGDAGRFEGRLYNADDGQSYDVEVWSDEPDKLMVKGCLMGVLCSGQTWVRVEDTAPGQLTGATDAPDGPTADPDGGRAPPPSGILLRGPSD